MPWSFYVAPRRDAVPESGENLIEVVSDTNFIEIPKPQAIQRASVEPPRTTEPVTLPMAAPGTVYFLSDPEHVGRIPTVSP